MSLKPLDINIHTFLEKLRGDIQERVTKNKQAKLEGDYDPEGPFFKNCANSIIINLK